MIRITYTIDILCADENAGAEAASELEHFVIDLANSHEVTVATMYEGTDRNYDAATRIAEG